MIINKRICPCISGSWVGQRINLFLFISLAGATIMFVSCLPEEERLSTDPQAVLLFSADTLSFDTLFTDRESITRRLKVYNKNKNAILIEKITLAKGNSSPYHVIINGEESIKTEGLKLLGGDSLLVLAKIKITANENDIPFLVKDAIIFTTHSRSDDVKLLAWGENANYISNKVLPCETIWKAEKPYVVRDTILVDTLCKLTLQKGTRVYFDNNTALLVKGTLLIEGDSGDQVLLRNSRLDYDGESGKGQWGGIHFMRGSKNNNISYAIIKNAETGIFMDTEDADTIPDLLLNHSIIENMSGSGISCLTSDLHAFNVLVNHCSGHIVEGVGGGNYTYQHCTFAHDFFGENPALVFGDNRIDDGNTVVVNDISINLLNNIIWGGYQDEIILDNTGGGILLTQIKNNIIKTTDDKLKTENIVNEDPKFINPAIYDYKLDSISPAINQGENIGILLDLEGIKRDSIPDIGAYEWVEEENQ